MRPQKLVLLIPFLAVACAPPPDTQEVEFRVPVSVREVETGTVEDRVIATGTLRTPETVSLRADTAGSLVGRQICHYQTGTGFRTVLHW